MELTVEKLQEFKEIKRWLDEVCEKYFNAHTPCWKYYGGWKFSDNYPNCILIHYGYYDCRDQYESGDEIIPMDVLIEFSKKLNK